MNETISTILSRRSIRAYKQEQIKDADLQLILKAGKALSRQKRTEAYELQQ